MPSFDVYGKLPDTGELVKRHVTAEDHEDAKAQALRREPDLQIVGISRRDKGALMEGSGAVNLLTVAIVIVVVGTLALFCALPSQDMTMHFVIVSGCLVQCAVLFGLRTIIRLLQRRRG